MNQLPIKKKVDGKSIRATAAVIYRTHTMQIRASMHGTVISNVSLRCTKNATVKIIQWALSSKGKRAPGVELAASNFKSMPGPGEEITCLQAKHLNNLMEIHYDEVKFRSIYMYM